MAKNIVIKLITALSFITMVTVNALANILPLNGKLTGVISDSYPNLFAPAGFTFAVWGVIYLLLALFVIFQFGVFRDKAPGISDQTLHEIRLLFIINALANSAWIFTWHYDLLPLSVLLMAVILVTLILIVKKIKSSNLSKTETLFVKAPFGVYYGWITVATIANVTTLLVSLNWNGFGLPETVWMIALLLIGTAIAASVILINRDVFYGLVPVWAYIGIIAKHLTFFSGRYPEVIVTASICILVFLVAIAITLFQRKKA